MKKNTIKLIAMLLAALLSFGSVSCNKDPKDEPDNPIEKPDNPVTPNNPNNPNDTTSTPPKDKAKSPEEQKEYLEQVALDFMNMVPSSDFRELGELGQFINDVYFGYYDWDNVGQWGKDIFNAAREALGTTSFDSKTENWGNYTYTYNYIYVNYKALLMASNFTGHFVAQGSYWRYEKANDLQFIFNDQNSQQLVLKVETSGETARVHAFDDDDWYEGYSDNFGYTIVSNNYYNRTACTIAVPEKIVVTLLRGNSQLIKTTVKINLSNLKDQEFDLSTGNITASTLIEPNNGYKFDISQVAYSGNAKASLSFVMSKNNTKLITMGVAGDLRGIPSVNVSEFSSESFDIDDYDLDNTNAKNVAMSLDILGKVQIIGTVQDIRRYVDYLTKADENDENEGTFKSYINQANALTDLNIYYNGTKTKQASVRLEPFREDGWYHSYWTAEPVLVFYTDGTSYSTFEAFFNQSEFRRTIDTFKALANAYADIIDEHIDW